MPAHNEDKLSLIWDKRQKDFVVKYPRRCDGALILHKIVGDMLTWDLNKTIARENPNYRVENLKDELESRGYDLTTLKFSVELKKAT
jgi:hypothetical protein